MSDLTLDFETHHPSMAQARAHLDAALQEQFPGGMLQRKWNGDVLELSGPGAQGSITYRDGRLVGHAELKPPASLMRPVIEQKISAAMKKAAEAA